MQSIPRIPVRSPGKAPTTQVEVTRSCGHVEVLEVRGDPARSTYLDNARLRECGPCYRARQTATDDAAVKEGKRCILEGSDKQCAWAAGIRQRRAVEFGRMLNDAAAWAKTQGDAIAPEVMKARGNLVRSTITGLFLGNVTWALINQDGYEDQVTSHAARWWIDTRELTVRDMVAALLPQFRWEAYAEWEPLFREEVVEERVDDDEPFAPEPVAPARGGRTKAQPDFDDEPW